MSLFHPSSSEQLWSGRRLNWLNISIALWFLLINHSPGVLSRHASSNYEVFETHFAPSTFTKLEIAPPEHHTVTLRIGLKKHKIQESIEVLINRVSDPSSPSFRKFLTDSELAEINQPLKTTIEEVTRWLESLGFGEKDFEFSRHQDWINLKNLPIRKVEQMLNATYAIYRHFEGDHLIRTESYSLPKHLHEHIDLIQPTNMFGRLNTQRSNVRVVENIPHEKLVALLDPTIPNTCSDPNNVSNNCLRQLYKTEGYVVKSPINNAIGITGYLGEAANSADAQLFLLSQRIDQLNQTFEVVLVSNGTNPQVLDDMQIAQQLGIEANLDTQTALGLTAPTRNVFYSTGGSPPFKPDITSPVNTNEPYLDWLNFILDQPISDIPKVISTSYGDDEQTVPYSYALRVCNDFALLGARGVSVIFSSGDFGVGQDNFCWANDGSARETFLPTFPATCPYVTSVGATENFSPEVAASHTGPSGFVSGGGFSQYFPTPVWQSSDVAAYLDFLGNNTYPNMFNKTGRGFPDVSAQGAKYAIAWQGEFTNVGGTSASAPTFASVITLLNDLSLSLGGSTLGYLNPWLYYVGRYALNDITSGSSSGCGTKGFPATSGWDPVTGLGTPNFEKLSQLIMPWISATAAQNNTAGPQPKSPRATRHHAHKKTSRHTHDPQRHHATKSFRHKAKSHRSTRITSFSRNSENSA